MVGAGEHEPEAELVDRLRDAFRRLLDDDPERLEDVGGAARRGRSSVAVFGNSSSRRGGNESCRRRDVEGARSVTTGADHIDDGRALGMHRHHVLPHRLGAAGDLVGGLALRAERHEHRRDLGRCRLAVHDLAHHGVRLLPGEVAAVDQRLERLADRHRPPSRKLRPRAGPSGVSTDSGWNWTPSTG